MSMRAELEFHRRGGTTVMDLPTDANALDAHRSQHGMSPLIGTYEDAPAQCHEYDPRSVLVSQAVATAIVGRAPALSVEHVGSTAVPGCDGKGIVDLLVLYPPGALEMAKT